VSDACEWLDRRGLLEEERGHPIGAHLNGCTACRERHAEIERLRADLRAGPADEARPRPSWEQAVWRTIDGRRRRPRLWWLAIPIAAAAALVLYIGLHAGEPSQLALLVRPEKGPAAARIRGPVGVGDVLVVEATGVRDAGELRLYRDDAGLVARCATASPCLRRADRLSARFPIPSIGRYRILLVTGPAPAPGGSLDEDLAALTRAGLPVRLAAPIEIW
jgi:hypothetical protein